MGARWYGLLAALVVAAALPAGAQVPRRAPCRTQCAFEARLRGDGCCPARAAAPSGPERCAGSEPGRVTCEATAAAVRPGYEAPRWVLERRPRERRSREMILNEVRLAAAGVGLVPPDSRASAEVRVAHLTRVVQDYDDLVAATGEEARAIIVPDDPARAASALAQRAVLRTQATQYREELVRTVRNAIDIAPGASSMDLLLFRMAGALAALGRDDESLRAYRTLLQRFPLSPYVSHAYLAFADHFFAQREWEPAAQFYERARLPADATNHARAYALYRLAWARLLSGSFAASLARFDEALAWANAHPDAPDVARLAEAARAEREVAAWAAAPRRTVPATRSAPEVVAQAADVLQATGDWQGALVLYRRLLAQDSLDARYCTWRAAATRAMDCLVAPPRERSAPVPREGPRAPRP